MKTHYYLIRNMISTNTLQRIFVKQIFTHQATQNQPTYKHRHTRFKAMKETRSTYTLPSFLVSFVYQQPFLPPCCASLKFPTILLEFQEHSSWFSRESVQTLQLSFMLLTAWSAPTNSVLTKLTRFGCMLGHTPMVWQLYHFKLLLLLFFNLSIFHKQHKIYFKHVQCYPSSKNR